VRLRGETSSLGQVSSVYSRSQGLCFFFSFQKTEQLASTSVTEAGARNVPIPVQEKKCMAPGNGSSEWRRPCPCTTKPLPPTACLTQSFPFQNPGKAGTTSPPHNTSSGAGHAHVHSANMCRGPGGHASCLAAQCPGPADTTRRQLTGNG